MKKIIFLLIIISAALFAQQKRTPLMDALEKRDIKTAIALINSGVDINTKDRMGETPLIEAAEEEAGRAAEVLRAEMESAVSLAVPLPVEIGTGKTWYDCK